MTVGELSKILAEMNPALPVFSHRPNTTMCVEVVEVELGTRWTDKRPGVLLLDTTRAWADRVIR